MTKRTKSKSRYPHTIHQILYGEFDGAPMEMRLRMVKQLKAQRAVCFAAIKRLLAEFWDDEDRHSV